MQHKQQIESRGSRLAEPGEMSTKAENIALSVIVTIVSGKEALRVNLGSLYPQARRQNAEIIVPFDRWSSDVMDLSQEFPDVRFHFVDISRNERSTPEMHYIYDIRRAAGISIAKGKVIALTEDHAVPAPNWCEQILRAHEQPFAAIGGAIENGVDRPINWAWYYCDFGRYGRPFAQKKPTFLSDVNISYKRDALMSVRAAWKESYQETTVNWELSAQGHELFLDERPVVRQERPRLSMPKAVRERISWGRVFAETRCRRIGVVGRAAFALGTLVLPLILTARIFSQMLMHRRTHMQIISTLPLAFLLSICWSMGELLGYLFGRPTTDRRNASLAAPISA